MTLSAFDMISIIQKISFDLYTPMTYSYFVVGGQRPAHQSTKKTLRMLTIKNILTSSAAQLSSVSDSAKLDSELLLSFVLNKPRTYLHTWPDVTLADEELSKFNRLLERRTNGEPIAHILGERGFWSLNLNVTADTLIPRPDTEQLVELALEIIPQQAQWKILDLGTGKGAIALSLAQEKPSCFITATDQSIKALEVAKQNAEKNQISNIEFVVEQGIGLITGQGENPRMLLELSLDGGRSFAHSQWIELGRLGEYTVEVDADLMVVADEIIPILTITDPVPLSISASLVDIKAVAR